MKINQRTLLAMLLAVPILLQSCKKEGPATGDGYSPRLVTGTSSKYISKIFEYVPAPGQLVNTGLGDRVAAEDLVGKARQGLLSLGGFGGYIIIGFDHSIENHGGVDLGVYGNPSTGAGSEWSESGIVMVMQDINGNGIPDDGEWLELAGSEYQSPETIKNYKITYFNPKNSKDDILWKDNQGKQGYILRNMFHTQAYYPSFIKDQEEVTFTGTLLKSTLHNGNVLTNMPYAWGYADNGSADYKLLMEENGEPYNSFDLSWAVDAGGNKVNLKYIDFVKIYTAQNSNGNPHEPNADAEGSRFLGEISTEIGGAVDLNLHLKK